MLSNISIGSAVSWGVQANVRDGIQQVVNGIVTSWDCDRSAQTAPCTNEIGQRIGERVYDYSKSASCTVIVTANADVPDATTPITIGGYKFFARSGRITESNQDYRKIALSLEAWATQFNLDDADGVVKF